ncbi:MAG: LPS export ABC transporter periplasmic protein LptC [Saprospiraceae bacterium]|nr:LPS export ABC transporter periplasmic protein LptC [Saprospiraceae bacterium]MBP9193697.1 LPS export ABC transporter periplasmic protein LptC [Saprospiraceae bacterium]
MMLKLLSPVTLQWWNKALSLGCLVFLLQACTNDLDEVKAITRSYDVSKDVGQKVKIIYSDSALVKLTIEAPVIERYNDLTDPKDVFPKGILITFLDINRKPESWLTADEAIREPKKRKMTVRGNVRFYNTAEDKLQTSELIWDENLKKIYTEKFIRITRPLMGDTIYGIGFETDQNFKRIEIKQKIKGKLAGGEFIPD